MTSPTSLSLAQASLAARPRSAGSGSARPYRPGCTLCVVGSFWRGRGRSQSRARRCSRAPSPPLSSTHWGSARHDAGHWVTALPWDALHSIGFAAAASLQLDDLDPRDHFKELCALVMPDSLDAISALPAFVNRLCCCRWTLLSQPLPTVHSAVIPPITGTAPGLRHGTQAPRAASGWPSAPEERSQ